MATKIVDVTGKQEHSDLPATQKVIHVEYTDPESGLKYAGPFTIQRLNVGQMRQMAITKAQLNGGMAEDAIDQNIRYINQVMAHLQHAIIKAPDWWRPDDFYSGDILIEVYEEVMNFEDTFRHAAQKRSQGAQANSQIPQNEPGIPSQEMVDSEVQAAAHA